jgi:hypothetical protein
VKASGGYSIAVYDPASNKRAEAEKLIDENRVNFALPANYSAGEALDRVVCTILDKIAAENELEEIDIRNK